MTARLADWIRRLERGLHIHRPGRSPWVWLLPLATTIGTFVICQWFAEPEGHLDAMVKLPISIVGAVSTGAMSAVFLTAFDENDESPDRLGDSTSPRS